MDSTAIRDVSATVVVLAQFAKWSGIPSRFGPLVVGLLALAAVLLWGWSAGDLMRQTAFDYLTAFGLVVTSAAGVFGLVRGTHDMITVWRKPPPPTP